MSFKIQVADALKHATKTKNTALTMQRKFFKSTYRRWRPSETGKKKKKSWQLFNTSCSTPSPFLRASAIFRKFLFFKTLNWH